MPDMIDKSEKSEGPPKPRQPALPQRPSYGRVVEDIEKWLYSSGLQKPK